MLHPFPLRRFIWIIVAGILTGALYAGVQFGTRMPGAVAGGSIAATLFALERFVLRRNAGGLLVADPPLQGHSSSPKHNASQAREPRLSRPCGGEPPCPGVGTGRGPRKADGRTLTLTSARA